MKTGSTVVRGEYISSLPVAVYASNCCKLLSTKLTNTTKTTTNAEPILLSLSFFVAFDFFSISFEKFSIGGHTEQNADEAILEVFGVEQ